MKKSKRKIVYFLIAVFLFCLSGCGSSGQRNGVVTGRYYDPGSDNGEEALKEQDTEADSAASGEEESEQAEEDTPGTDLFMVITNNMQSQTLVLKQLASGKQYMYNYSIVTRFLDKYGNRTSSSDFASGRCITVEKKDVQGRLLETKLSDSVWEYPDVTRYTVDEEHGIFKIADMKYIFDDNLFINSDGENLELADISEMDTLRLVGIGKRLLSVSVTTGHGELKLTNTDLFEGSFIQIGEKIFSEITKDMLLEIPEGTYTVTVANNGYGGSTDVTILRNETEELDLDTLKGEGPKFGNILFAVDVSDAIVLIDGQAIDYSEPVSLQYGLHSLIVMADSYDTYSKKLFVNSKEATIIIGLDEGSQETVATADGSEIAEQTASEGTSSAKANTGITGSTGSAGSLAGSKAGSLAGGTASSGTTNNSDAALSGANADQIKKSVADAAISAALGNDVSSSSLYGSSDYISTLTEVLKILTGDSETE